MGGVQGFCGVLRFIAEWRYQEWVGFKAGEGFFRLQGRAELGCGKGFK